MGTSPYGVVLIPCEDTPFTCADCVMHQDERCLGIKEWSCNGDDLPKVVHKLTGVVASDEDLIREYTRHKQEVGLWVSLPMKSK